MRPFDVEPDYHKDLMQSRNFQENLRSSKTAPSEDFHQTKKEFLSKTMNE